jgi:hypothetical protein
MTLCVVECARSSTSSAEVHDSASPTISLINRVSILGSSAITVSAQDNYEIQVYGSETVPRGMTMVELHNNSPPKARRQTTDGTLPTHHAWHETIEVTHGFNEWFETGFYLFMSARNGSGWDFVGTHIRPRFRVPPKWHWPVGVSLSQEIGWVRRPFSRRPMEWEIRPIIDKEGAGGTCRSILRSSAP